MRTLLVFIVWSTLLAGAVFWWTAMRAQSTQITKTIPGDAADQSEYELLNQSKVLDLDKHYIVDFSRLRDQIIGIQARYPQKTYVYFLYLNNGSWIGRAERDEFTAASVVKVPLAMAVYKAVEEKKLSLSMEYELAPEDLDSNFGNLYKVGAGKRYTLGQLIEIMLVDSDNTARNAIYKIFASVGVDDPLAEVYSALGWEFLPEILPGQNNPGSGYYRAISVKVLSNMFLALYNATYLDLAGSQAVLDALARTQFDKQLRAGVPESVTVAHKIGVSALDSTFTDCGIVYAPSRAYILCTSAAGMHESEASRFMSEVSKSVYEYVISQ